jgi:serine/threonine protein kinase
MKTCPLCGAEYPNSDAFCFKDGRPLVSAAPKAPPPPSAPPPPPADSLTLEGVALSDVIAVGYSTALWRGRDAAGQAVAVRVLVPSLQDRVQVRDSFVAVAKLRQSFEHPNLVAVRQILRTSGLTATVSELIDGVDVAAVVRRQRSTSSRGRVERTAALGVQAAGALAALHAASPLTGSAVQLLHGRLSTRKLMVQRDGLVRLLGGGLVPAPIPPATPANNGLYAFLAPEQIQQGPLDSRTDVYALCLSLWTVATGRNPNHRPNVEQTARAGAEGPPPLGDVSAEERALFELLREGLHPDPYQRPSSIAELALGLQEHLGGVDPQAPWRGLLAELFPPEVSAPPILSGFPASDELDELRDRLWSVSPAGRRVEVAPPPVRAPIIEAPPPVIAQAPILTAAPPAEVEPIVEPAPVEEPALAVEPAPVEEPTPLAEPAPIEEPARAVEPAPAEPTPSAAQSVPPVADAAPAPLTEPPPVHKPAWAESLPPKPAPAEDDDLAAWNEPPVETPIVEAPPPKKSGAPMIVIGVAVLIALLAAVIALTSGGGDKQAPDPTPAAVTTPPVKPPPVKPPPVEAPPVEPPPVEAPPVEAPAVVEPPPPAAPAVVAPAVAPAAPTAPKPAAVKPSEAPKPAEPRGNPLPPDDNPWGTQTEPPKPAETPKPAEGGDDNPWG